MNLQLSLKNKWFDLTERLIKREDYREITPYFCNRFLLYNGEYKTVRWWSFMQEVEGCFFRKTIQGCIKNDIITYKHFTTNTMTLGYPKSTDKERILRYEHAGIEIRTGDPEWGAEPDKLYFVIKHGKLIK